MVANGEDTLPARDLKAVSQHVGHQWQSVQCLTGFVRTTG
jgi:hypothetical protein